MFNFNGGSTVTGTALTPLGAYTGLSLLHSGNFWVGVGFLTLSIACFALMLCMLARYAINYQRYKDFI
jgi:hypothetical protein